MELFNRMLCLPTDYCFSNFKKRKLVVISFQLCVFICIYYFIFVERMATIPHFNIPKHWDGFSMRTENLFCLANRGYKYNI